MKTCENHPEKKALSVCSHCKKYYCSECLDEGKEFYYCRKPECQEFLKKDLLPEAQSVHLICPNCESELELSDDEITKGLIHCTECDILIDFTVHPPKIINREKFVELLSSLNQGDIWLIKSILESSNIDYYVFGENFLSIEPLLQPARFFVNENQLGAAKELLKDFEPRIWGASKNDYEE